MAASHSEVLLNEAADRDVVVSFVGKPHRIDDRGSQVLKSLKEIGYDQYYQAEQRGWVLYVEGSTDLAILRQFARKLKHPAAARLERPFVHYVENLPQRARTHFHGLREAKRDLVGFALFDRLDKKLDDHPPLREYQWRRREIENYLSQPETILAYVEHITRETSGGPLLAGAEVPRARETMQQCIEDRVPRVALRDRSDRWWLNEKLSDVFLDPLFEAYYQSLGLPNLLRKTDYHVLAEFVPPEQIDDEVREVLDAIIETADRAKPLDEQNAV